MEKNNTQGANPLKTTTVKSLEKELREECEKRERMESLLLAMEGRVDDLMSITEPRQLAKLNKPDARGTKCRISLYKEDDDSEYKVVKSWKTVSNIAVNVGKPSEIIDQRIEITLEDGEKVEMQTEEFLKEGLTKDDAEVVGVRNGIHGQSKIVKYNGKEYSLLSNFVN